MSTVLLGRVVATPGALAALSSAEIERALTRHAHGDWGDVGDEDAAENARALAAGDRVMSVYYTIPDGTRFWIITEWDRSVTTVLLPEEY